MLTLKQSPVEFRHPGTAALSRSSPPSCLGFVASDNYTLRPDGLQAGLSCCLDIRRYRSERTEPVVFVGRVSQVRVRTVPRSE